MSLRSTLVRTSALALLALLITVPASAQEAAPNIAVTYTADVAPADMSAFSEGLEGWVERMAEDGETWTWNVFQTFTGPPRFVIMSPGHTFADFDRDPTVTEDRMSENEEYMQENVSRYLMNAEVSMMQLREDISNQTPEDMAPPFWQVISWELTDGSTQGYLALTNAWTKVREAVLAGNEQAAAAGEDPFYFNVFNTRFNEGPPRMLVSFPVNSMADLDGGDPLGFFNLLAATHGHEDAVAIEAVFSKYLTPVENNIYVWRQDLSYAPDGM